MSHHDDPEAIWQHPPAAFISRLEKEAGARGAVMATALDLVADRLDRPPRDIIDLGSGTGVDTLALARRFPTARVHALDVSAELLDHVRDTAEGSDLGVRITTHHLTDDRSWPPHVPARADLVWAALSLHHMSDPSTQLRNARAALGVDGVLVAIEPTADSDGQHHQTPPFDLEATLESAGFRTIHVNRIELVDAGSTVPTRREVRVALPV